MPRWTRRPLRLPWLPVSERTVVRALGGARDRHDPVGDAAAAAGRASGPSGGDQRVAQRVRQ